MPRLEGSSSSSSSSYISDLGRLVSPSSSFSGNRLAHLRTFLLRSVRIKLISDQSAQHRTPPVPLRVRPAFIVLNVLDLLLLGLLGFHPNGQAWTRLNDKVLHFICFFFATSLFYMIWDVDEAARRVWLWRNAALLLTFVTCFACGSIGSEIVQSLLPYKTFDIYDVVCNMIGSSLGLFFTYHLELRYRARREIQRLYDPLDVEDYGDDFEVASDEDDEYRGGGGVDRFALSRSAAPRNGDDAAVSGGGQGKGTRKVRFGDVEMPAHPTDSAAVTAKGDGAVEPQPEPTERRARPETLFSIDNDEDDEEEEQVWSKP
ncbi:hypothetical protein ACQY0O_005709 [Thecaphora frezii]